MVHKNGWKKPVFTYQTISDVLELLPFIVDFPIKHGDFP